MDLYVGIDPGSKGCLALIWGGKRSPELHKIQPELEPCQIWADISNLKRYAQQGHKVHVVLEQVGGYVGKAQPGSAMFNFGRGVGLLQMALYGHGFAPAFGNMLYVTPQRWQKSLGIVPKRSSESKTEWKNRLKDHAQVRFEEVKVTLQVADALLIAEFCRLKHQGKIEL